LSEKSIKFETTLQQARKQRILDVCEGLFLEQGFKRVTMELIAEKARISKVTLYRYFQDKDAAFKAVANRFASKLQMVFVNAIETDAAFDVRISHALIAKHEAVFDTIRNSAYAAELFAAKDRVVSEEFKIIDRNLEKIIANNIDLEISNSRKATDLARILFASAQGIADNAQSRQILASDIQILVQSLLRID
jgi:AcrR family transcriptional regulator